MIRRLYAWRKPSGQETGSVSPQNRRAFAKAKARYRRAQEQARETVGYLAIDRSQLGRWKGGGPGWLVPGAPHGRLSRQRNGIDSVPCLSPGGRRFDCSPHRRNSYASPAIPEEECGLWLRTTALFSVRPAGRNSCFGSTGKRTESLGPQVKSSGAITARRHTTE